MSDEKALLREVIGRLPLDAAGLNATMEGIEKLSDADAKKLADGMTDALDKLPSVLDALEEHLTAAEKTQLLELPRF